MALNPGTRVGPYEVIGTLGSGGMGEVYRGRDSRLGRDVALKILPAAFSSDPERLGRFQREAQVLAALNHPHIAQIYGLEDGPAALGSTPSGGGGAQNERALVMELVEGPTLADMIVAGPQDTPEALRIARQIALALEVAHDRGITHRDLKPSNVKVASDGSAKVLDFGLAKLSSSSDSLQRSALDLSASPTLTSPALATGVGVILGTAAYMSPEQARGKAVDKRADIWAFGCVLYEMLTGRRAFEGEDVSDTLAGVLRGEPDWSLIPSEVSPTVRLCLRRCVMKDPSQRIHDIADVRLALEGAFDVPVGPTSTGIAAAPYSWKRMLVIASGVASVAILAAVLGGLIAARRVSAPQVARLTIVPSSGVPIVPSQSDPDIAVSPDGSHIAYISVEQGTLALYIRALDRVDVVRVQSVGTPRSVFFSPDGESIGFFDGSILKRVATNGGPAVAIASVNGVTRGASWGEDGSIIYATNSPTGLMRVSAEGGAPVEITKPHEGEDDVLPEFLPGGRGVLYTRMPAGVRLSNAQIAVLDLKSGRQKTLIPGGSHARYASTGHLVYGVAGTLRAVSFDLDTLTVRGNPVPVVERVVTKANGPANFDVSRNGTLVYQAGDVGVGAERSLVWVDRQGREELISVEKRSYVYPRISPDGKRVALDIRDQENDIWVWDVARQTLARLTFDPGLNRGPVWTPDGQRLIFSAERDGPESLFWQAADGSGAPERLTTASSSEPQVPYSVTPDGSQLLFSQPGQPPFDLFILRLGSDRKTASLLNAAYSENNGEVSPDGRWLVYQSDESGSSEIYVRRFPSLDSRSQVSSGGGTRPVWARNGRELFYLKGAGMVAVPVELSATSFSAGVPKTLFEGEYYAVQAGRSYDVSSDGKRFLMIKNASTLNPRYAPQVTVVLNWTEELKRLVPAN